LGIKGSLFDHHVTFDADAFYIDWKNIQLTVSDPVTGFFYFENGGKSRSTGLEGSMQAHPLHGMTFAANITYTDAVLKQDLPPGSYGLSGDRLPYAAKLAGTLSLDQERPLTSQWTAFAGVTAAYTGNRLDTFAAESDYVRPVLPAYATLDIRAGVKSTAWRFSAYVSNVTDKYGILSGHPTQGVGLPASPFYAIVTRPRTVGVSAGYSF
jgi:outer membrane cobalamin receptor